MESPTYDLRVEFLVSTSAQLATEKVNKWIVDHPEYDVVDILPIMSYSCVKDKAAMMVGCMIKYFIFESAEIESDDDLVIEYDPDKPNDQYHEYYNIHPSSTC